MKTLLLNVDYTEPHINNYWAESYVKNKLVSLIDNDINKTVVKALEDTDGVKVSYKGRPQNDIFVDSKEGTKQVGYIYRVTHNIYDDNKCKWVDVHFNAWVNISQVNEIKLKPVFN